MRAVALTAALLLGVGPADAQGSLVGPAPEAGKRSAFLDAGSKPREASEEIQSRAYEGRASAAELRWLGEVHASMGKRAKALVYWKQAADAGDPRAPILIADHYFERIFGRGARPGPGMNLSLQERPPSAHVDEAAKWYRLAVERDDREDSRSRAQIGLDAMTNFQILKRILR